MSSLLRALDTRFADFPTQHRVAVIVGFCPPASAVFGVGYQARQSMQRRSSSPADHDARVQAIAQQVQRWNQQPASERLPMWTDRLPPERRLGPSHRPRGKGA